MSKTKVFIDGREGTTGLRIVERLSGREDIECIEIDETLRKDPAERARLANQADIVFLCLPDDAARETVSRITNPNTKVIDASTAHRTDPDWAYGFPELSAELRNKIINSKRTAVPGCYASGFNALVYPLIAVGLVSPDYPFVCHAVSGYSGAGKKGIAQYEEKQGRDGFDSPRQYALGQKHKHLPEMQAISRLTYPPIFNPMVCNYYAGMVVSVPLHTRLMAKPMTAAQLHTFFTAYYAGQELIHVRPFMGEGVLDNGFLDASTAAGYDDMEIFIAGHEDQILLAARLDNLGKGASGAAVQCMNLMLGMDQTTGLSLRNPN